MIDVVVTQAGVARPMARECHVREAATARVELHDADVARLPRAIDHVQGAIVAPEGLGTWLGLGLGLGLGSGLGLGLEEQCVPPSS